MSCVVPRAAMDLKMRLKRPQASLVTLLKECMFITHMFPRAWHAVRLVKTWIQPTHTHNALSYTGTHQQRHTHRQERYTQRMTTLTRHAEDEE